ncbi:MAG: hypothetical protein GY862_32335 [Gammaproteobacteria bacterium]|nr:hypothetical protein [Gammaproteobacteria bacterium]
MRDEGIQEGKRQDIIEILEIRFGKVPKSFLDTPETADLARLNRVLKESVRSASLDDFIRQFESSPENPLVS